MTDLEALARTLAASPALRAKEDLKLLDALPGLDGDDGALVPHTDGFLVVCAEAIEPALVRDEPFVAGAAAVATNVADVRAMGGRPLALVDTLVSPDETHARRVLDGLAWASDLLGVPVVGGHLTLGGEAALSATCTGVTSAPLRATAARPGDVLVAAYCLDGELRRDGRIFTSLRARTPAQLRDDGDALVEIAEAGLASAARDVSMPGTVGSLVQFAECAGCGADLEVDAVPRPAAVDLATWLATFPSYGFLLAVAETAVAAVVETFTRRGLAAAACGRFVAEPSVALRSGTERALVRDLAAAPLTGLTLERA